MAFRRVTIDIGIDYGIWDHSELIRWDGLVIELEKNNHTLESIKETPEYLSVVSSFHVDDSYLQKLIHIHENLHEK